MVSRMSALTTIGKGLTPKQQAFCKEYLVDLNGTQAAIRAGYSKNGANVTGSQLLANPNISECIQRLNKERSEATKITRERVLTELARIAFFDFRRLYDESGNLKQPHELDEDTAHAIGGIDFIQLANGEAGPNGRRIKYKAHDKTKALALLCRHLGLDKPSDDSKPNGRVVFYMPEKGR